MGAWIEITSLNSTATVQTSLPSWERGLKSTENVKRSYPDDVAPLVGAWIEICVGIGNSVSVMVAPLVGAWIEISTIFKYTRCPLSLPSWERGLKCKLRKDDFMPVYVAPLVGAWIEIRIK